MKRGRLALRSETIAVLSGHELIRARGGGDVAADWSFVYACTAPWSADTTCAPSNPYVCPMGPQ